MICMTMTPSPHDVRMLDCYGGRERITSKHSHLELAPFSPRSVCKVGSDRRRKTAGGDRFEKPPGFPLFPRWPRKRSHYLVSQNRNGQSLVIRGLRMVQINTAISPGLKGHRLERITHFSLAKTVHIRQLQKRHSG